MPCLIRGWYNHIETISKIENLTVSKALLIACPMGKSLESCPLNDFRKFPLEDIVKLTMTMDEDQLDEIIEYHQKCLHERVDKLPPNNQ